MNYDETINIIQAWDDVEWDEHVWENEVE